MCRQPTLPQNCCVCWGCKLDLALQLLRCLSGAVSSPGAPVPCFLSVACSLFGGGGGSVQLTTVPLLFCALREFVQKGPGGILEKTDDKGKIVSPVPRLRSFPFFFPPHRVLLSLCLPLHLPAPRPILGKPNRRYEESCLKTEVEEACPRILPGDAGL